MIARVAAKQVRRTMSTQSAARVPFKGQADGGHPYVLQKEGDVLKTWFNPAKSPEILPVVACVGFACALAGYKAIVVDGMGKKL